MKNNEALKNIFLYAALAISALFLRGGCRDDAKKVIETIYVPKYDTLTEWILPRTDEDLQNLLLADPKLKKLLEAKLQKIIYRYDPVSIQDRSIDTSPVPVDTPVLILFTDHQWSEDVKLFEGEAKGENGRCTYKYLAGVQFDSLQFIAIEGDCRHETKTVRLDMLPALSAAFAKGLSDGPFQLGAKVGWSPQNPGLTYGLQSSWKGAYGAINYTPNAKSWMVEGGFLLPIGAKAKQN